MRAGQIVQEHWIPNNEAAHPTDFEMQDHHRQAPSPALYFQAGRWLWCWWSDQFSRALRHKRLWMYFVSAKLFWWSKGTAMMKLSEWHVTRTQTYFGRIAKIVCTYSTLQLHMHISHMIHVRTYLYPSNQTTNGNNQAGWFQIMEQLSCQKPPRRCTLRCCP